MKKVVLSIIATAFLFATMEVALKIGGANYDSLQLTFLRFLLGGIVLLPLGIKEYKSTHISRRDWLWLLLVGTMCIPVSMLCFQLGIERSNAATASAIICMNPIFTMMIAHIFTSEKMSRAKYFTVTMAMAGCFLLMRPWDVQEGNTPAGLILTLIAAITFGAYTVMGKKTLARIGTFAQTSFSFILGSLVLLIVMLFMHRPIISGIADHPLVLAYVGIIVTGVGYLLYFLSIKWSDATTGSLAFFIKPGIAPIIAVVVLGETIEWNTIIGIGLFFIGSFVTLRENFRKQRMKLELLKAERDL